MKGLKAKREKCGLTLSGLGEALGLSMKTIFAYESGKRFPSKKNLDKLCNYFKCTIDELI